MVLGDGGGRVLVVIFLQMGVVRVWQGFDCIGWVVGDLVRNAVRTYLPRFGLGPVEM